MRTTCNVEVKNMKGHVANWSRFVDSDRCSGVIGARTDDEWILTSLPDEDGDKLFILAVSDDLTIYWSYYPVQMWQWEPDDQEFGVKLARIDICGIPEASDIAIYKYSGNDKYNLLTLNVDGKIEMHMLNTKQLLARHPELTDETIRF